MQTSEKIRQTGHPRPSLGNPKWCAKYPIFVGRSLEETLRVIEALQLHNRTGFATPADWFRGDPVLVPKKCTREGDTRGGYWIGERAAIPSSGVWNLKMNCG